MHHILICDDEPIICQGMASALAGTEGLRISLAYSGQEALDLLEKEQIDSMILDIHMPVLDGLETLRILREELNHPLPVVIISGYDTFDYAQQALRYGCMDYHLKPLKPEKIRRIAEQLMSEADSRAAATQRLSRIYSDLNTIRPIIHDRLFFDLMDHSGNPDTTSGLRRLAGIDFHTRLWSVILMEARDAVPTDHAQDYQIRLYAAGETIKERIEASGHTKFFHISAKTFALICGFDTPEQEDQRIRLCGELINRNVGDYQIYLHAGSGSSVDSPRDLRISYVQAQHVLTLCDNLHYSGVVKYQDVAPNHTQYDHSARLEYLLVKLNIRTIGETERQIEEFLQQVLKNGPADYDSLLVLCTKIILAALQLMEQNGSSLSEFCRQNHYHPLTLLLSQHQPEELSLRTGQIFRDLSAFIRQNESTLSGRFIEQGKQFIREHYTEETLSVGSVAGKLFLSQNYFGQLFKSFHRYERQRVYQSGPYRARQASFVLHEPEDL